jgi:ABC-type glycerol-3-phosphate transport system substrate-binding protein
MDELLNRLSLTSRAAPAALPNLILVDHQTLEIAALKGLLLPISMESSVIDESIWIPEILQTGKIQETQFGLPVVGDSLILFRKDPNQIIPDLDTLISSGDRVSVDLADKRSSLALSIYLSLGGYVEDGNGRPMLDEVPLRSTLEWFRKGKESGSLSREQNIDPGKDLIWSRYANGNLKWWLGWYSDVPSSVASTSNESRLPPIQGTQIMSISDGWYWAFPNPDSNEKGLSDELTVIYTQPEFLDTIADVSGWLPVLPAKDQENPILASTQLEPDGLILVTIAPILQDSVLRVLMGESPELVAQQAVALFK